MIGPGDSCGLDPDSNEWWHSLSLFPPSLGIPAAIVVITLALHPQDYVASGHCWLNVHTDAIWAFVGPVLFVLTVSWEMWVPQGRDMLGRGDSSCPLIPNLQANTYILVRVVMVTVSSTHRHARMLSPQPGLQQKIRFQMW